MKIQSDFTAKSFQYLQKMIRESGPAASASYTLIGAIILLGGIGYVFDKWLESSPWFLLGGLLLGLIVGFYELAKTVWGMSEKGRKGERENG
ncbi:MAG: AtpZ/AtpI family protein [Candidatus Marinimicrobia bacterium]|nr:AtpZ/AtpI family protein [Candidatus Neomarinimicrobiota bacterium]MBL7059482.1 AtpZ/AtpI family protein [Candidatus Neomarinimicrobiota bacterium]